MRRRNVFFTFIFALSLVVMLTSCSRAESTDEVHKASFYIRDTTGKVVSIQNISFTGSKVTMPEIEKNYGNGYRWYDEESEKVWVGGESLYKPGEEVKLKEDTRFTSSGLMMKVIYIDFYDGGAYERKQYDAYEQDGQTPAVITLEPLEQGFVWQDAETGVQYAGSAEMTIDPSVNYIHFAKVAESE